MVFEQHLHLHFAIAIFQQLVKASFVRRAQPVAILRRNSRHHFIRKAGIFYDAMNLVLMKAIFSLVVATHALVGLHPVANFFPKLAFCPYRQVINRETVFGWESYI
jgi:hypothetical protein